MRKNQSDLFIKIKHFWRNNPLSIIACIFIFGTTLIFFHFKQLNLQLVESITTQSTRQYVEVLKQFRSLYTSEVVNTLSKMGIEISHDYHLKNNAIPLPATLSLLLGEKMGLEGLDVKAKLYSAYPFPWRKKTGGLTGEFEKNAWQQLNLTPDKPYIEIETVEGVLSVRYAIADVMRPACVECHNTHPDTPRIGWKAGDVRGVLEVIEPLTMGVSKVNHIFVEMVSWISVLLLLGFFGFTMTVKRLIKNYQMINQSNKLLAIEIEERKQAEARIVQAKENAEFEKQQADLAKEDAISANRAKSTFLANISHEIRTPMNAILGYTQILQRDRQLNDDQLHSLSIVGKSGEHLLGLINDILDLSKMEAGATTLNMQSFDLVSLCSTLSDMFKLKAAQKKLKWNTTTDLAADALPVLGDEGKIRQILINLIGNAIKFTDKGYVNFSVCCESDNVFSFEIEDSGIGIASKYQRAVFDAFNQGDVKPEFGGSGLGLTISQKYLKLMGSELKLESEANKGCNFSFHLPLTVLENKLETEKIEQVEYLAPEQNKRILVVDDVQVNRTILHRMLDDVGFDVIDAYNGRDALNVLKNMHIDLIFTDLMMPIMDGNQLLIEVNKLDRDIPVVAISASSIRNDSEFYIEQGFDFYISKPFHFDDIYDLLKKFLKVKFIYRQNKEGEVLTNENLNSDKFVLPNEEIKQINLLCQSYQVAEVESILVKLSQEFPNNADYFATLNKFVKSYDLDGLCGFLAGGENES
ncbi:response regulator [Pseudoalteromonas denitrificans]|uniref:histidine kinase n=1 Tax=Pseudoalteromonas denitrificans DSM 6059 TaxID=1123010 RepID=A0A1I1I4Z0_9GAMM|nr:response regulator [Pseudoalteromonas denitrificans]SFC31509.1 Signal transduction histidine kinase [Pseudoalteromonas denitrificans DSM 6059]